MLAEYSRALERIFENDEEALARANELLSEAEEYFAPQEVSLPPAGRRHNAYVWRLLQLDDARRVSESAYDKLARIRYGGYGTDGRVHTHHADAAKAAERQELGEEVSKRAQKATQNILQPVARLLFFIETPPDKRGEWHVYENVSERNSASAVCSQHYVCR